MTLSQEKISRIYQLYDICYGLASEAERVLFEEDSTSTISSVIITKYWRAQNLEPRKKGDVLENLVKEAFSVMGGDPEKMNQYLRENSLLENNGQRTTRIYLPENVAQVYSRKLGLKIKINKNHARNLGAKKIFRQIKCGTKPKSNGKYGLFAPPEIYS